MGRCSVTLLLALSALSLASAFHTLVPNGKELVYDYKALVKAGTVLPASYASEFFLHGKLHVQSVDTNTLVQLSDLKYKLYNGERHYGHEHELEEVAVPEQAADLLKTFKVMYDKNGQAKGIATEKDQKMYARNMHKAIANMLQLDLEEIHLDGDKAHAFTTEEYSIYGKTVAAYNVLPKGEGRIDVQKMHEMKTTKPMYYGMLSNIQPDYCEAHYEEPMSHDSHQYYYIKKHDGHYVAKHIESTGGVYIYPFQAKSEAQYVFANVTLNLLEIVPVQKALQVASEHVEEDLTYDIIDPSIETDLPDIMNGRRVVDMQKQIPIMESMMTEMGEWLHKNHLHMHQPDIEHGQLVNRMVRLLTVFNQATLEQMYNTLSTKTSEEGKKHMEIMHQLLPLVGTHASVMLVKKIVHEKKVDDHVAMHMLHSVPSNVRVPTEKMLEETEDMLTWGNDLNVHVRKAAVLCFASLIHKTFQIQKRIAQGPHHHHHQHDMMTHEHEHINLHVDGMHHYSYVPEHVQKFVSEHKIYDKYVNDFVNKMKLAKDIDTQMLYMHALYNTKLHSVVEHLVPIVKGEEMNQHKLRLLAMWAIAPMVLGDAEKVFELYWPIFSDWNQHLELRIIAYYAIMQSHPPISRLLNIYWEMQAEPNTELYHFHYNYLMAMSRTTDPCHQVFRLNAAQILKLTRKPNQQGMSTYYQMDYLDKQYKFGGDFNAFLVATESSRMFGFEMNSQMFNVHSNYYSFFFRIGGLKGTMKKVHLNLDSTTELFNYNEIWNMIKSIKDMKDVNIQISMMHHHQIVQSYYYDSSNMKDLHHLFECFHDDKYSTQKRTVEINYEMFTQIVFPTEMGLPAMMEIMIPSVQHKHINMNKEVANHLINIHMDNMYHISRHSRYGLSFYNPIADIWQGVNRYHSYDLALPLFADITINTQQHSVKVSMKRHEDEHKDVMGLRSHVTTLVFVKDDLHNDVLTKSCAKCEHFTVVTKGDQYRHNYTLYDKEGYNTGYNYQAAVYDSELHASKGKLHDLMSMVANKHNKNYWTPMGRLMLFLRNWHMLILLQPTPGTHGILFKAVPSTEHPITQIDLTFRLNKELTQEKDQFLPGMKFNTRFTYALKNKEKTVKTWDMNAIVDVNAGHSLKNVKMDLTRIIPGQKDFKVCMESTKKWTLEGVTGHMNMVMGQSADGKCNKDGATIDVTMVGEQLEEQKTPYHSYEICQPYSHNLGPDYHSMRCLAAHTAIRKYTMDIKTTNVATEFKKYFYSAFDHFKQMYKSYYVHVDEHDTHVEEDSAKVVIEYPMAGHEMDIEVVTPHFAHEFTGVPTRSLSYWGFYPDNTHFSKLFMMMHHMGMMHMCMVHPEYVQHGMNEHKHVEAFQVPNEWTMFVGDVAKDAQHGVFLKKVEGNMMALKTVHGSHSVEIHPEGKHGEHFKILVDGKEMSDAVDYHTEDWFSVMVRPHVHSVVMTTFHFQLHMEYTGDQVMIEIPKVGGVQLHGHCMMSA